MFSFKVAWLVYQTIMKYNSEKRVETNLLSLISLDAFITNASNSFPHFIVDKESIFLHHDMRFIQKKNYFYDNVKSAKKQMQGKEGRISQEPLFCLKVLLLRA